MFSATVEIANKTGLHARPASQLVAKCQAFQSNLCLIHGDTLINLKNIISILSAGLKQGTMVTLTAEGPDEEVAGREILEFIKNLKE